MHPVIQRLLEKKSELYGRRHFLSNLLINFIFTAIWTALTVTLPGPEQLEDETKKVSFYQPISDNMWRVVLECLGLLMAVYFVLKVCVTFCCCSLLLISRRYCVNNYCFCSVLIDSNRSRVSFQRFLLV